MVITELINTTADWHFPHEITVRTHQSDLSSATCTKRSCHLSLFSSSLSDDEPSPSLLSSIRPRPNFDFDLPSISPHTLVRS